MRILSKYAFLLSLLIVAVPGFLRAAGDSTWSEDYAASVERAKSEGKPILLLFTGSDWCYYCKVMDKEVFTTETFTSYADKHLVLVKADFPKNREIPPETKSQNEALASQYGVRGFPTILVLSTEGKVLASTVGAQLSDPEEFIKMVREAS